MPLKSVRSFFARIHEKYCGNKIDNEIFNRIFAHTAGERDFGYPFDNETEMLACVDRFDVVSLLDRIEDHIRNMPDAYAKGFRYIVHRELAQHLHEFENLARRRVHRPDPFAARRFVPVK